MTSDGISASDRAVLATLLAAYAVEDENNDLEFEDPGGDAVNLARRLIELGWTELDMTEATMEWDSDLQFEWFNAAADAAVINMDLGDETILYSFLLTWNPKRWVIDDDEYADNVQAAANGGFAGNWSVGVRRSGIEPGDIAYLFRQDSERGIVASGVFTSGIYEGASFDDSKGNAFYADVNWTSWLPIDDRLPEEILETEVSGVTWKRLQGSGIAVNDESVDALNDLWEDHLDKLGATPAPEAKQGPKFKEGGATEVHLTRYERNPKVRAASLAKWGYRCSVCDFDFEEVYGDRGHHFIHVHHLTPMAAAKEQRSIDPETDLRPVCPNCHAMIHRTRPAMTIDELKANMGR